MLTIDEVRRRTAGIDDIADDPETAHRQEDRLYRDVLNAIAAGAPNPAELAKAALVTQEYNLDRYYSSAHA